MIDLRTSIKPTLAIKEAFFDREAVKRKLPDALRKCLSAQGAFVRKRAQSLLRKRKGASPPGQPPHRHGGHNEGLGKILFAYEESRQDVIIGPVQLNQFNQKVGGAGAGSNIPIPSLMEHGGAVAVHEVWYEGNSRHPPPERWRRVDLRYNRKPWHRYRRRIARYQPRPFMQPALALEQQSPKFMALWKDSIK